MKIKANAMGFQKPFTVKPSVKKYKLANKMLIKVLKMQALFTKADAIKPSDDHYVDAITDILESEDQFMDDGMKFLQETFRLNDKQMEVVESHLTDSNSLADYISYVIQRVKGASDQQIEADEKRTRQERKNQDPKK
ncbi:phage tail tube assembly chaperone [uncultured Limosilactobacillus sp.]|uniref:phage tail tube assembly chaperone n=1 Tax=uncultured Limosilactobacillus sp. TaxID=2837629 RepID=UPI0025F76C1C|nr:phage tail tube assembly chaperone [uncultured Limosilactobacillus sp.]